MNRLSTGVKHQRRKNDPQRRGERYSFARVFTDRDLPLSILAYKKRTGFAWPLHYHPDAVEFQYIHSGAGCYFIEGQRYVLEKRSVLMIGEDEGHSFIAADDPVPLCKTTLIIHNALLKGHPGFQALAATIAHWHRHRVRRIHLTEREAVRAEHLLASIEEEMKQRRLHRTEAVMAQLMEFLVILARSVAQQRASAHHPAQHDAFIERALDYIDSHLCEKLTVRGLAAKIGYSGDHLSHVFKRSTGMRLGQYIALQRVRKAEQWLQKDEKYKVLAVASDAGFFSLRTFNRCFKRFTGMTPRAYQSFCLAHRR